MNKKILKVYLINDDGGPEFAVIWDNKEEVLKYLIETLGECENDTLDMITELSKEEIIECGFGWSFDKGETILNGIEVIEYIYENNITLKEPLIS